MGGKIARMSHEEPIRMRVPLDPEEALRERARERLEPGEVLRGEAHDFAVSRKSTFGRPRPTPRPPFKMVGGKGRLLRELRKRVPARFDRYCEPFCGGAALFFDLYRSGLIPADSRPVLSDADPWVVRTLRALRDDVDRVVELLAEHQRRHSRARFEEVRRALGAIEQLGDAPVAAARVYLSKTAFNGLWRVNRAGEFNAPFGDYAAPAILDEENLRACGRALRNADLVVSDFEDMRPGQGGDFYFFDSPYVPASATANFTRYTPGGFSDADQRRLAAHARRLKEAGAAVLLTNSDTPLVRELYPEPFWRVERVEARGNALNSDGAKRGRVGELLIS